MKLLLVVQTTFLKWVWSLSLLASPFDVNIEKRKLIFFKITICKFLIYLLLTLKKMFKIMFKEMLKE